jgi:predicted amidophosphoribosyltransferase
MALGNCKRCGSLYSRVNESVCPKCIREEEEQLERVNQWLRAHPGQNVSALSEATGIDKTQILQWARQKWITLSEKIDGMECKRCGDPVAAGTLCSRCKLSLAHDVDRELKGMPEHAEKERRGMHYHRKDREKRTRL